MALQKDKRINTSSRESKKNRHIKNYFLEYLSSRYCSSCWETAAIKTKICVIFKERSQTGNKINNNKKSIQVDELIEQGRQVGQVFVNVRVA